jgi:hypothetical protein
MKIFSQSLHWIRSFKTQKIVNNAQHLIITGLALAAISCLPTALAGHCEDANINCLSFCLKFTDFRATATCCGGCQMGYIICKFFAAE